jgi:hypothetical protein
MGVDNLYNKQEQHLTFVTMCNVPALSPNATPPVSRFFTEMSKKRQRCVVVNLENNFSISAKCLPTFTVTVINNYPRISGKMDSTIKDKALIVNN